MTERGAPGTRRHGSSRSSWMPSRASPTLAEDGSSWGVDDRTPGPGAFVGTQADPAVLRTGSTAAPGRSAGWVDLRNQTADLDDLSLLRALNLVDRDDRLLIAGEILLRTPQQDVLDTLTRSASGAKPPSGDCVSLWHCSCRILSIRSGWPSTPRSRTSRSPAAKRSHCLTSPRSPSTRRSRAPWSTGTTHDRSGWVL